MSYFIKEVNYFEEGTNKFYILLEFPNNEIFRISYELINKSYEIIKEKEKYEQNTTIKEVNETIFKYNKNIPSKEDNNQSMDKNIRVNEENTQIEQIEAEKIDFNHKIDITKKKIDVIYKDFNEDLFQFNLEEKRLFLFKKKRNIKFINRNDEEKEYIVYSSQQIAFLTEKENLTKYFEMLNSENKKINYFEFSKIARIVYIKEKEKLNPFKKYESRKDKKSEYTLNFDTYFKTKNFKFIKTKEREKLEKQLLKYIYNSKSNIKGITGISGIGKSISILNFLTTIIEGKCYFNLKEIHNFYKEELIVDEVFKLFSKKEKFDDSLKNVKSSINYWEKIDYFLGCSYENNFETKIIVFDQYKTVYDPNYLNILKLSQKYPSYKFIICSSINDNFLRDDIIYSNFFEVKEAIIPFIYINQNLCNVEDELKNDKELKDLLKEFNYFPKFYNEFLVNYRNSNNNNIEKFLFEMKEKYFLKIEMFYIKRKKKLCRKYKIIQSYINNQTKLSKEELREIIEYLPLKYIKIMKHKDCFIIDFSFKFLNNIFSRYYKQEIIELNENKIINSNKRGEIGNIFDDIVNENFSLGKTFNNLKIGHKIIVDSILNFDKIFDVLVDTIDNGKEYDIQFFENFNKKNEIELGSIFNSKNAIFIEQYYQGENYDGAVLIPNENNKGMYDLFLYQTSIKKDKKYYRNEIYREYLEIKYKLESFFGIVINNGYFSFILYYEEKDIYTINRCKNEYLDYFFYSIDKKLFVDNNGNKITSLIHDNSLIYKKDLIENLENVKKNLEFFENCFHYRKGKSINNNNSQNEKINFLGKKRLLSRINIKENKYLNLINKNKNLEMINEELKIKEKEMGEVNNNKNNIKLYLNEKKEDEEEIATQNTEKIEENENKKSQKRKSNLDKDIKTKEIITRNENDENEQKGDKCEVNKNLQMSKISSNNDELEKENKELFNQIYGKTTNEIDDNKKDDINKEKYNIKEKIKHKNLPKNIKDIFSNYNYYIEYGNKFFLGLNIIPKIPYILICVEKNNFIFICYEDKENKRHIIDITTKKELNDETKIIIFNGIYFGKYDYYFWELF